MSMWPPSLLQTLLTLSGESHPALGMSSGGHAVDTTQSSLGLHQAEVTCPPDRILPVIYPKLAIYGPLVSLDRVK
jgi:hypothetical protein